MKRKKREIDWIDFIVISKKSRLYIVWRIGFVISCLISSYQFTWFAVFGHPEDNTFSKKLSNFFEFYFILSIFFNFIIEYEEVGQVHPVRDFMKIITHYSQGWMILDLIPCIPM